MDSAKYAKELLRIASKNHVDAGNALSEFLDFLIETFDVDNLQKFDMDYTKIFLDARERDEDYFELMTCWFLEVAKEMDKGGTLDFFGRMYEETWKGKGKASALGQYYTPEHICSLMAEITKSDNGEKFNDCACGSGRTMLAAFGECDKTKFHWFDAEDIDSMSCKMCALNFMVHGMIGEVKQQDTLTLETPFVVYKINEVRYPIPTNAYSIRRVYPSQEKPKELKVEKKEEPKKVQTKEKPKKVKKVQSVQLELF